MDLSAADLLPGEVVVATKKANAVVSLSEVGLQRLAFDQGMRWLGLGDKEALGGKLHLTSFRLLFASHALNRTTGRLSVFLPSIVAVRDASRGLTKTLEVTTSLQQFEFIAWGVPKLIEAIRQQQGALGPDSAKYLLEQVGHVPTSVGDAFTVSATIDRVVRGILPFPAPTRDLASDPLSLSTLVGLFELGGESTSR